MADWCLDEDAVAQPSCYGDHRIATDDDDTEDDICVGYPEHRGVRETYRGDDGFGWECTVCGAEGWEDAVTSDGIPDDYENLSEGASPNWTIMDELPPERRVAFIGQPSAGKSELAGRCGERCDGTVEEEVFELLPGFVGMIHGGRTDLSRRVKEIVRGEKSREDATEEALRRLEEGPTMSSFSPFERDEALRHIVAEDEELLRRLASNDGLICKCPVRACVCQRPIDGSL